MKNTDFFFCCQGDPRGSPGVRVPWAPPPPSDPLGWRHCSGASELAPFEGANPLAPFVGVSPLAPTIIFSILLKKFFETVGIAISSIALLKIHGYSSCGSILDRQALQHHRKAVAEATYNIQF